MLVFPLLVLHVTFSSIMSNFGDSEAEEDSLDESLSNKSGDDEEEDEEEEEEKDDANDIINDEEEESGGDEEESHHGHHHRSKRRKGIKLSLRVIKSFLLKHVLFCSADSKL